MSEGDVNLIRDEDVLRRMWQQTEDFGRKKEIRAHMYRLREERLRNLYSPEPTAGKGCEFSSGQAHVDSFADQTFQSMKSKEVRDAGSPPKEFTYRGQELKERSNAGWNVESEDRTTDDGRTHVKSVNANIEGQYDVDGGRGQFAAVDRQRHAVTEFQDDNTHMRRDESSSGTTAREYVERRAADGTRVASTTSSSNTSSRVQQVSSTVHETPAIHDYVQPTYDSNRYEKVTKTINAEQNDLQYGELVSRKIDYPDDNTKVIVETRCLPDGTRVTSTRKEFRAPAQSTRSEYQSKSESKSYSSQQKSDFRDSSSKTIRHTTDGRTDDTVRDSKIIRQTTDDIVDSQRHVDDYDFKRQLREYSVDDDIASETHRTTRRHNTNINKVTDRSRTDEVSQTCYETRLKNNKTERHTNVRDNTDDSTKVLRQRYVDNIDQTDRREVIESHDDRSFSQKDNKTTHQVKDSIENTHSTKKVTDETSHKTRYEHEPNRNERRSTEEPCHHVPRATDEHGHKTSNTNEKVKVISKNIEDQTQKNSTRDTQNTKLEEVVERKTSSEHYQTTYQSDFQQKKVSNDWSPTHQAWASTLRADTPPTTRPSTRASSPGSKTFKSSSSSLRSSVSPDKTFRKPTSRGGSPNKVDRYSPTRFMTSDRYSSTHSTHSVTEERTNKYTSPDRKPPSGRAPAGYSPDRKTYDSSRQRPSVSPDKRPQSSTSRPNASPERSSAHNRPSDGLTRNTSPTRAAGLPSVPTENAEKRAPQPSPNAPYQSRTSPERKPTANTLKPFSSSRKSPSPDSKISDDFQKKLEKSPERDVAIKKPSPSRDLIESEIKRHSLSPDRKPGYMRLTSASQPSSETKRPSKPDYEFGKKSPTFRPSQSPDRKSSKIVSQVQDDHYKLANEETKMHTRISGHSLPHDKSPVSTRKSPGADIETTPLKERSLSPHKKTLVVTENDELNGKIDNTIKQVDTNTIKINKPDDAPRRETSPNKFGTYDKKKSRTEVTKESTLTATEDVKYDSLKHRDQKSPKKVSEITATTTSPRNSLSPVKSSTKDSKFKNNTDFISTERTTEESTKRTTTTTKKEHPRQLLTPSSSPTRKPKVDTEPSTGQSSPTTSVSGFVYFGSPRSDKPITDLDDDFEPDTDYRIEPQNTRPDSLEITRSISPSKKPCRSPSPKRDSPAKETLPRKSSLKKPTNFGTPASPMDKPPSSFNVSPSEDRPDVIDYKVVKKDQPDEPQINSPIKAKPPLTRRETYEDRCRLILGMVNSSATDNIKKATKQSEVPKTDKSSPSVSPCDSPIPQESVLIPEFDTSQKNINMKIDVTDFITKEHEEIIKKSKTHNEKSKIPSRESSPTKLQDIISRTTSVTQFNDILKNEKYETSKDKAYQSPRQSPENVTNRTCKSPTRLAKQNTDDKPISKLPQTEVFDTYLRETSPAKLPRPSISPERKPSVKESPEIGPGCNQLKETSSTKKVKINSDEIIKTTEQSVFDTKSTTEYIKNQHTSPTRTLNEKSPRTRILESPSRQYSSTIKCVSPKEQTIEREPIKKPTDNRPKSKSPQKKSESPEKVPVYLNTTSDISSKYDKFSTTEEFDDTSTSSTLEMKQTPIKTSVSPTCNILQDIPRSLSPTKSTRPTSVITKKELSPERKQPRKDVSENKKERKNSSPTDVREHMKTTASTTSKNDVTITESEMILSKTVEKTIPLSKTSGSPSRKAPGPRMPSPTKFSSQPTPKDITMKPKETQPKEKSPTLLTADLKLTKSSKSKNEIDDFNVTIEDTQETITSNLTEKKSTTQKKESPMRDSVPRDRSTEYPRSGSPPRPTQNKRGYLGKSSQIDLSSDHKLEPSKATLSQQADEDYAEKISPTIKTTDCLKTTTDVITQLNSSSTTNDFNSVTPTEINLLEPNNQYPGRTTQSPVKNSTMKETTKHSPEGKPSEKKPSVSPDRKPGYMKPTASMISKHETTTITKESQETILSDREHKQQLLQRASLSRQSPEKSSSKFNSNSEEPRQLRTPSPTKKTIKVTEVSTEFLMSEREQEILDRVQKSLRNLSPDRKEKSPSHETSQTTSLHDLDITSATESVEIQNKELSDIFEDNVTKTHVTRAVKTISERPKDQEILSKPSSRNVSPIKKAPSVPSPREIEKNPESLTKSRSISPRKPLSQTDRPQSPRGTRASGIRPRDQVPFNRKPTPATLSTYRIEKLTTDFKKTNGATKQSVVSKTTTSKTTTNRNFSPNSTETETKRIPTKNIKENISPSKHVMRTVSDSNIKPKKTSPQRIKSKPEIQVNDVSTKSPKYQKPIIKDPHTKLPVKPKSATALNTSVDDDDDIIIDVQQSKSSRENSPDRICPTPVNFSDDVGIPRFPDEVSEPDDEYRKRTHQTIHETESVVDDIVEICEDEELFVKKTDITSEYEDNLLSINNKTRKHTTKVESVTKPKDTMLSFKNIERKVHSDFTEDNKQSDECLLSVSEKVNKFAKGPRDTKDSRSPSRKITDDYDTNTIYQDDYTKLSVNDKAHLFVETADNIKVPKVKLAQKVQRPDLSDVDESLKKDDCLLSVSDKVNKFVKTAESFLTENHEVDQKERKIKEQHENIIRQIVDEDDQTHKEESITLTTLDETTDNSNDQPSSIKKDAIIQPKDYSNPKSKPTERTPTVKITTLRGSEAVKKAKALFENIASTQITKDVTKTTKLTDIGVVKKSSKTDSTIVLHHTAQDVSQDVIGIDCEVDTALQTRTDERFLSGTPTRSHRPYDDKPRASPNHLAAQTPEVSRSKSPMRQTVEITATKTELKKYPGAVRAESPKARPVSPRQRPEADKLDKVPGYLRPTKTSQIKEETKVVEETEVSTRRGSGKFGVELRRTSTERATVSSERRRSDEHHQPCIEDIFDLDLLEQMLEKVVGYEQRRRIRSQIRIVKNQTEQVETHTYNKVKHTASTTKTKAPEQLARSPDRVPKSAPQRTLSPESHSKTPRRTQSDRIQNEEPSTPVINGHAKEPAKTTSATRLRPHSPEKPKSIRSAKSPIRQPSPVKKRTVSPTKTITKPKASRFNEYASAYMKKVGLNETDKVKFADKKNKKASETNKTVSRETQSRTSQEFTTTKSFTTTTERTSSRDVIEFVQVNGKRSPSPERKTSILRKPQSPECRIYSPVDKTHSPERRVYSPVGKTYSPERAVQSPVRKAPEQKVHSPERKVYSPISKSHASDGKVHSPAHKVQSPERRVDSPERKVQTPTERLYQRSPSPEFKRQKNDTKRETIIKTVYDTEKKIPGKPVQDEKPSWVTNRNLKKITAETRTFSAKKVETEKPKYRAQSPSKVISKPTDVITSSYGPGPLDADGRPLFGIRALRNGATNFQVKGTVIRQEFHSRNGGEPEGTVSVTAYSSQPGELEQLMASQGLEPPSRIHGLSAITTTKKFGGETGISMTSVNTKEERASLEQFTHTDRRIESQLDNMATCTFDTREEITGDVQEIDSRKSDIIDRRDERVAEIRSGQKEERRAKVERRQDKKTVRQSSVKSLTEKFIKTANDSGKTDRSSYPKAGLILRTTSTLQDSLSSDEASPGLARADSDHSLGSTDDVVVTTSDRGSVTTRTTRHGPTTTRTVTRHEPTITRKTTITTSDPVVTRVVTQGPVTKVQRGTVTTERSFLDSNTKVTGVQDILTRMKNADIVIEDGDTTEDSEARALLNKFLGATVLMAGMQNYVTEQPHSKLTVSQQETVRTSGGGSKVTSARVEDIDLDQCWDERLLRKLLDECTDYEQRRRLRARIRTLMAEQEACAAAVTDALGAAHLTSSTEAVGDGVSDKHEKEEVTVTSSVRRDSTEKTSSSSTTTNTSKVIESVSRQAPKNVSPFAKFRQLEKQNSTNSPSSPKSPGSPSQPYFKFTDPALQCSAITIKERLLQWCRDKTRDYENVKLENFSTSWADGLAFCALVHHFLPDAFDYSQLSAERRRHNFTLAFKVADEKAGIYPLLDVDDMVAMRKPDWKCVFTYVQAIHRRFKDDA